jgi:hypothetical protein
MSEPHEVVKLLVARMESNPEEFNDDGGRWAQWLDELIPFVTEEERLMLRKPMMQSIHEEVMDELCNGEERRRKAEEDREYERHLAQAMQHTQRQAMQGIVGAYSGGGGGVGAGLAVANGGTGTTAWGGIVGGQANSLVIDDQVLDASMIKRMKRMMSGRRK